MLLGVMQLLMRDPRCPFSFLIEFRILWHYQHVLAALPAQPCLFSVTVQGVRSLMTYMQTPGKNKCVVAGVG